MFKYITKKGKVQKHIGIIEAYDPVANTIYTIEGNANDAMRRKAYSTDYYSITGYGINGSNMLGDIPVDAKKPTDEDRTR